MWRAGAACAALAVACALAATPAAAAPPTPQPYGTNDAGGFHDVLPPGTNGFDNALDLFNFESMHKAPAHSSDQLPMYRDLLYAAPGLSASQLSQFYKDSTFGVKPGLA